MTSELIRCSHCGSFVSYDPEIGTCPNCGATIAERVQETVRQAKKEVRIRIPQEIVCTKENGKINLKIVFKDNIEQVAFRATELRNSNYADYIQKTVFRETEVFISHAMIDILFDIPFSRDAYYPPEFYHLRNFYSNIE